MTLHFSDTKSFSRKQNKSAVASIAYRSGTKLRDDRNDKTHNYSGKSKHVTSADIILPSAFNALDIELDRETIWNDAERAEKRKDARVAREWLINLPHALDEQTRKNLAHRFAQKLADRYNVIADCCIHKPSDKEIAKGADPRNFHAHIMLTTREIELQNGQIVFTKKATSELSDTDRKKLGLSRMSDEMTAIKQLWDETANPVLKAHGLPEMDWRSHQAKGDDLLPQIKMGVNATQLERQGKRTRLGDINREIKQKNEIIFESRRQHERETDSFIKASHQRITARKREIDFVRVIVARTNHEIRVRERTFEQTERNVKYIVNGSKLNDRQREARLSLIDENKRTVTDTERTVTGTQRAINDSKRTATDTDRVIENTVNEFEQRKLAASDTDQFIDQTAQYINQQRIERERLERIERERQERIERERKAQLERERIYSINRLARSLQLSRNEKGYDFENANTVYDEFLKHYEPITEEQFQQRAKIDSSAGKMLNRVFSVYNNGLMSIKHYERNFYGEIKLRKKFFETSEIATFNGYNRVEFKDIGVSLDIDPAIGFWVKNSIEASERYKRLPPQTAVTPKPTLGQPRNEPTHHENTSRYRPRF